MFHFRSSNSVIRLLTVTLSPYFSDLGSKSRRQRIFTSRAGEFNNGFVSRNRVARWTNSSRDPLSIVSETEAAKQQTSVEAGLQPPPDSQKSNFASGNQKGHPRGQSQKLGAFYFAKAYPKTPTFTPFEWKSASVANHDLDQKTDVWRLHNTTCEVKFRPGWFSLCNYEFEWKIVNYEVDKYGKYEIEDFWWDGDLRDGPRGYIFGLACR